MPVEQARAFAPGRVNLIGEHTDYNGGLALPFAIAQGVTVSASARASRGPAQIQASAQDLGERDEFTVGERAPDGGWRAFVRGAAGELARKGWVLPSTRLEIGGDLPRGAGLSSSAALEVALCLALIELAREPLPPRPDPLELARLCARVENDWVGARTGLLDQLASLCGEPDHAVLIDFRTLDVRPVPLALGAWRLLVLDSGERHEHASSGYNTRREECARACELLGIEHLSEADEGALVALPERLRMRARHVLGEDKRVRAAVLALQGAELERLGSLLDASHESLRDLYEVSTPAVDVAVTLLRESGAAGARMIGGGFGGSVLGLFPPGAEPPPGTLEVRPASGCTRARRRRERALTATRARAAGECPTEPGGYRRAQRRAAASSGIASDIAIRAPSSGSSRLWTDSGSLIPSLRSRVPVTDVVRRRSSRAGADSRRWARLTARQASAISTPAASKRRALTKKPVSAGKAPQPIANQRSL